MFVCFSVVSEPVASNVEPPDSNFQLESLILAQNERWRRA
jgi:hypothetical protein